MPNFNFNMGTGQLGDSVAKPSPPGDYRVMPFSQKIKIAYTLHDLHVECPNTEALFVVLFEVFVIHPQSLFHVVHAREAFFEGLGLEVRAERGIFFYSSDSAANFATEVKVVIFECYVVAIPHSGEVSRVQSALALFDAELDERKPRLRERFVKFVAAANRMGNIAYKSRHGILCHEIKI
jgi:hypothetical protein